KREGTHEVGRTACGCLPPQRNKAAQQSSSNKAAAKQPQQSSCNKATATKTQEADPKPGQPLFHLPQPESSISPP
ncbi:MAG: hypothetical protein PUH35_00985, partial [Bacteroidales bacterium]|uniref:hypothetical protein n=1 Tax=Candidatus Cryptobacteroides sp. TaxID=2952915 RepID=UPI002A75F851